MKTIHLNNRAHIVLTAEGAVVYNTYGRRRDQPFKYEGDTLSLQLWELLKIFGPKIEAGQAPFFENAQINIAD